MIRLRRTATGELLLSRPPEATALSDSEELIRTGYVRPAEATVATLRELVDVVADVSQEFAQQIAARNITAEGKAVIKFSISVGADADFIVASGKAEGEFSVELEFVAKNSRAV